MKYRLKDIIESITNGQRKQALRQLTESDHTMQDLFSELLDVGLEKEVLRMFIIAGNIGYISFNPANVHKY